MKNDKDYIENQKIYVKDLIRIFYKHRYALLQDQIDIDNLIANLSQSDQIEMNKFIHSLNVPYWQTYRELYPREK